MLAAALGINEIDATELLKVAVAITFAENDPLGATCAEHVRRLISRTIRGVSLNSTEKSQQYAAEVVIGACAPRFKIPHVFVNIGTEQILIGSNRLSVTRGRIHPIGILLGACYAVGAALKAAMKNLLPFP